MVSELSPFISRRMEKVLLTTPSNLILRLPVNNKKEKDTDHNNPDLLRHKRHADEDRHELHHHHFDKSKSRKRIINMLTGLLLKIIIAVSYFSILLCSYISLSH